MEGNPEVLYGATPNMNQKVGGWMPFYVGWSQIYKRRRVFGATYTDYRSGRFEDRSRAVEAAKLQAAERSLESREIIETTACHRCWDEQDVRHMERTGDGAVICGHCSRLISTT